MRGRRTALSALGLALLAVSSVARAQDGAQASDPPAASAAPEASVALSASASTDEEVRAFLARGVDEYAAGRWAEARALFEQAHRLRPTARTARGIGMAAFNQRDYVGAVTFLALALSSSEQPLTDVQRSQAEDLRRQALSFVGRFRFDVARPEARIEVRGEPTVPGAECILPIGSHLVRVHAPGFLPTERTLEVRGGEEQRITLALVQAPFVAVAPAAARQPVSDLWGYALLGGAGAVATAALGVQLRANGEFDDLEQRCERRRCFPESTDTSKVERLDNAAAALWIASGALAVSAGALLTTHWLRARKRDADKVLVAVGPRALQLQLRY